jgi:hypothetical protein
VKAFLYFICFRLQFRRLVIIDAHRGEGGRGAPHVTPIKNLEKLPHINAIKHDPPWIFSQPQVPPSKEFAKKPHGPPPWISNFCASID